MIPASNATLANTIPGPPRALVVIARFTKSSPRNPANLPARETDSTLTTQLPARKAAIIPSDSPRTKSSLKPTIAKYTGINTANDILEIASSASAKILRFLWTTAKPARKAANTRLTPSAPAKTQYPSNTAIAYPTGEFLAKKLNLDLFKRFTAVGSRLSPNAKNP